MERWVQSGDIRIWTESFGDPTQPAALLIMGTSVQGIGWPDELVRELVSGGLYVIRFDHRDTGYSDYVDFASSPYSIADMADDCTSILDGLSVRRAHLVGASLGGSIAQWLAVHRADRVLTLTAIMASPMGNDVGPAWARAIAGEEPDPTELPPPSSSFLQHLESRAQAAPAVTLEEEVNAAVETWRVLNGAVWPFDEDAVRAFVATSQERSRDPYKAAQHDLAGRRLGEDRRVPLSRITAPTLVVHGTEDPILRPEHGQALADEIPGAHLVLVEGMGHDLFGTGLPRKIARLVLDHTSPPTS